ncbi:hypothetical protein JOB18_045972 [Solea senegalensis]|uniref:Uncharacterized protein n=1 Tax=Solea senegalensis TaxID=28829 RepID=A0AAV6QXV9_SOLSE|nr:hypothetical protein JOB18_045972 [Solea senegalensis]
MDPSVTPGSSRLRARSVCLQMFRVQMQCSAEDGKKKTEKTKTRESQLHLLAGKKVCLYREIQ